MLYSGWVLGFINASKNNLVTHENLLASDLNISLACAVRLSLVTMNVVDVSESVWC
jgi:hypothetical protein